MKIVSVSEMKRLERENDAAGNTYADMMERAGTHLGRVVQDSARAGLVLALVGPGNNGGDGLVAARYLATQGVPVRVHLLRERPESDTNWRRLRDMGVPYAVGVGAEALALLRAWLAEAEVVVDALLGTGARPPVQGDAAQVLAALRDRLQAPPVPGRRWPAMPQQAPSRPVIVAADVPSGLDADSGEADALTPVADVTVTMGLAKQGLLQRDGLERTGDLVIADIALAGEPLGSADLLDAESVAALLPARPASGHKGTFGAALVVGGSSNYVGAALLAAAAASRVGVGLVGLASLMPVLMSADAVVPEAVRLVLPAEMGVVSEDAVAIVRGALRQYDALVVGPGLTQEKPARQFVEALVLGRDAGGRAGIGFVGHSRTAESEAAAKLPPLVIDADGLNALASVHDWAARLPPGTVLTPHPGEMARLLGTTVEAVQADRLGAAMRAAQQWRAVVVLKGAATVIADAEGGAAVAPFANPALASGGTGDVLAGAIAGLLAQGLSPAAAARAGVYLHGVAGELARRELGAAGVVAGDLLTRLPRAQQLLRAGWR